MSESLEATTERLSCVAIRKDGQPCTAPAVQYGFCVGHQPNGLESRRKGGKNSSLRARAMRRLPEPLSSLLETLEISVREVHSGQISASQGSSIASLISVAVRVVEYGSYEKRLEDLERDLHEAGLI